MTIPDFVPATLCLLLSCCAPSYSSLPIAYSRQETKHWCWAAAIQMMVSAKGINIQQCAIVNRRLGRIDCCHQPESCDFPVSLEEIEMLLGFYRINFKTEFRAVALKKIQTYIKKGSPLIVGIKNEGLPDAHVVVVAGYLRERLLIYDPWDGAKMILYQEFLDENEWFFTISASP